MNTHNDDGFTILELSIVIVLIALLMGVVVAYIPSAQLRARDNERKSDVTTIKNYFEEKYVENASAIYPTYPSTDSLSSDLSALINSGLRDSTRSPGSNTTSISTAITSGDPSSSVTISSYVYQPFLPNGNLCTSSSASLPCVRFKLWYKLEENSPTATYIESLHQQ